MITFGIWLVLVIGAFICSAYSFFGNDRLNYTDAIAGILAVILWFIAGLQSLTGISDDGTVFQAGWLMWLLFVIGIIVAIITFVKILDLIAERKNGTHVEMGFMGLER